MMYHEFLALAKITPADLSAEQYAETVELVYMHHPAITNTQGKAQIVAYYRAGLIPELLPRARKNAALEDDGYQIERELDQLEQEYNQARARLLFRQALVQQAIAEERRR